jgi:hypothetical protein
MSRLWNTLVAWLKSKNITTHTIGVAAGLAMLAISDNAWGCRDLLLKLFHDHPSLGADIVLISGAFAAYKRSSSNAGAVAVAKVVMDSPNAPTSAAIDAANTATK